LKKLPPKPLPSEPLHTHLGIPRRDLLRIGAAGLAAAVGGIPADGIDAQQPPAPPDPATPPTPPSPEGLLDPRALGTETWSEGWVWRPEDWPGQALDLNVIMLDRAGDAPAQGQVFPGQFSFGGISPAPTIRIRGDATLRIKLRNLMGPNHGAMAVGACPDPVDLPPAMLLELQCRVAKAAGQPCPEAPDPAFNPFAHLDEFYAMVGAKRLDGHCMTEPSNSQHASRVTNIHTHGLHVQPNSNVGRTTQSDNVFLRVMSKSDWAMRQAAGGCPLGSHERVGEVDYEFILGNVLRRRRRPGDSPMPQPPGTHWYHPHAHGSTHDQVASGMAGYLIIEGDVDEAINRAMCGMPRPDPAEKTGPYDYRERLVFIQRVLVPSSDINTGPRRRDRFLPAPIPDVALRPPGVAFMRPGAIERWRVLNGSVDGRGFKRFMVVEGEFVSRGGFLWHVMPAEKAGAPRTLALATPQGIDRAKQAIYQLAADGVTLVTVKDGKARHAITDLSKQNAGTIDPLSQPPRDGESWYRAMLRNVEEVFRDGASIRNAFVRPNEIYMATGNRADIFFQAPLDGAGKVYTILAQEVLIHTDNFQQRLQQSLARGTSRFGANPSPVDVVLGHVHVRGAPVEGGAFDVMSLAEKLPPVPPFLQPIADDELRVQPDEATRRRVPAGSHRTRVISYSGYGGAEFPVLTPPEGFCDRHPQLERLSWARHAGANMMLPPFARTMAINGRFDLGETPEPPIPRKFSEKDLHRQQVLVDTAEEWALYNCSIALWGHTDRTRFPQAGGYTSHVVSYPVSRADGQARFHRDQEFQITAKGADHPFHIHVNPCWVTRIEIPDESGRLHNILAEPRWMDVFWIPRNAGRVVFRTRFADFAGRWIHHCHILLHEDHGMMQEVECGRAAERTNYYARSRVASSSMSADEVSTIYPPPSLKVAYQQTLSFVDANPTTGQVFPGFPIQVPTLED
jgi:FtsP/CotA-like multicopper oxidase with cupredoxin domain